MRKLLAFLLVCGLAGAPVSARAGIIIEASLGKGLAVSPEVEVLPGNFMLAPGVTFLSMLRLQLGLEAMLPDVADSELDLALRPMLTISPPLVPVHGRLILAFTNLFDDDRRTVAYGAALGTSIALAGVGLFAELGLLPRSIEGDIWWVLEVRAGVSFSF